LTEKIVKWGAGLSAALLVIGPLVALLPSFVAGIRLLSSAFVPFLVGGAIALGFKKLLDYFDELSEKAYKAKVNLNELSIAQLDAEIQRTKTEIEKARKELETMMNLPLAQSAAHGGAKAIEDTIKRLQNELRILEEQRASLNVTEEEATKIGEEESKIRKTLDEIMAQYSDEVENAKGKIESETESKIKMLSVSEKLAHQINILNAEYELTKKELEDTEKYYQDRIALTEEYVAALEKEKQGLIEGSQERAQVELQILSAKNEIQDYKEKLKELTEVESNQLEGLELVNAQLGVLENKYSDVTKSEEYFTEKAELLTKQQELLNEKLEEAEPNSEEFFEYTNKLIENKRAIEDNIKAEEEFNKVHDLSLKGIDLVNAQLSLLEKQYKNTGDEIAYTEEKTRLLQEKADLLTAALDELEKSGGFQTEEWFALQEAIEETKNQMEELTDSTNDAENVWADFFTNLQSSYGTAISNMQTAIQQFTSSFQSALSDAITSLFTMKEQNNRIKDEIAQKEEEHKTTMQKLQEEYNEAVMNGNDVLAAKIQQNMQDEEDKHKELIEGMKDDYVTTQSIAEKFWSALKTAAINALAEMIAKQITSALLSLVTANPILALAVLGIGLFTWLASQVGGVGTGGNVTPGAEYSSSGGAVSSIQSVANFMKGGMVEYLQAGGPKGTDTVNTWLTPGEYVISKPMTDFIRRTGVVTSDLVNAIRMGNVTPAPTFAGEGAVSPELGSLEIGSGVTIEELNVAIYAQTLDENAISEAGPKIFSEFQKQLEMRGLALTEV
jgi:DNA repair exonuclease SbcCD ATPase subunit